MADYQKVIVLGRLTRDPESSRSNSGTSICKIGIVTNKRRKMQNGEYQDNPQFLDCTCFGKTADFVRDYLKKGNQVLVDLDLDLQQWEDNSTGQKRSKMCFTINSIKNLTPRNEPQQQPAPPFPVSQPQQHDESINEVLF